MGKNENVMLRLNLEVSEEVKMSISKTGAW
jgi:hypothetical protein